MKKLLLFFVFISGCEQQTESQPVKRLESTVINKSPKLAGLWRGVLQSPGGELSFGIQMVKTADGYEAKILNGPERVDTSAVVIKQQNIVIQFSWYDARIKATFDDAGQSMQGEWSKMAPGKISKLPFTATRGYPYRFEPPVTPSITTVGGIWQAEFVDEDGTSVAVGEFQQSGQKVNGTFLTPTGDYRFLSGHAMAGQLKLSAFDGAHAFLFDAKLVGDQLQGGFWSRDSYYASWTANLNDDAYAVLPDSWGLVNITTEDNTVSFAFEDLNGKLVQLTDDRFKDKPVLINSSELKV